LNVNGKVDKRKLPEIKAESSKKKNSAPRELTFLEKKISAIIEKIIGHSDFDISENLINAGMTSLSVIKLAVELNKVFGFEAQVKKMMKGCSVLSIEDELQEFMFSGTANPQTVQKRRKERTQGSLSPFTKAQLGVYIDCMKNPYSTLYNIPSILTFSKSVDAQKLAD
ncbi:amino acid adenylation domain protein, partial [human gut metagenome]